MSREIDPVHLPGVHDELIVEKGSEVRGQRRHVDAARGEELGHEGIGMLIITDRGILQDPESHQGDEQERERGGGGDHGGYVPTGQCRHPVKGREQTRAHPGGESRREEDGGRDAEQYVVEQEGHLAGEPTVAAVEHLIAVVVEAGDPDLGEAERAAQREEPGPSSGRQHAHRDSALSVVKGARRPGCRGRGHTRVSASRCQVA